MDDLIRLLYFCSEDSEVLGFSSDSLGLEDSSWRADTRYWNSEFNETDTQMIFDGAMDSDDEVSLMRQDDMDVVGDAKSVIGDLDD